MFFEAKCAEEQSVLRSKMFFEAKCAEEKSVLRSKMFFEAKRVEEQGVLGSNRCWGVKCVKEQTVTSQFEANCSFEQNVTSKVCVLSKVFFEAKCASALKWETFISFHYSKRYKCKSYILAPLRTWNSFVISRSRMSNKNLKQHFSTHIVFLRKIIKVD